LGLRLNTEFGLLNSAETVKTLGAIGDGLNAFCNMRWPYWPPLGGGGKLWFEYKCSPQAHMLNGLSPAGGAILRGCGDFGR
jgi:hypothetical protein